MENLNADWPGFPRLKFMRLEDEPLEDFLSSSIRRRWAVVERILQLLYDQQFVGERYSDRVQMQIRIPLPKLPSNDGERWFSALIEWGAPSNAWEDTHPDPSMKPEATIQIYEAEKNDNLTKIAHCVILDKDMHVKVRVDTL